MKGSPDRRNLAVVRLLSEPEGVSDDVQLVLRDVLTGLGQQRIHQRLLRSSVQTPTQRV